MHHCCNFHKERPHIDIKRESRQSTHSWHWIIIDYLEVLVRVPHKIDILRRKHLQEWEDDEFTDVYHGTAEIEELET